MKATKDLTIIGLYTALLIGGQIALAGISGVEIVTLLITAFAFYFGVIRGTVLATVFSVMRCFVFGFFPNILILYLVYYNLFAVVIGLIGKAMNRELNLKKHILVVLAVALLTVIFTLLDNIITPNFFGYSIDAAKAYWVASLTAVIPQTICAVITVGLLNMPLVKLFDKLKLNK
ncbi:MAG: hypothetical protein E7340_06575 [Clostridiales bacterium]|nr:hypothetical protein [Clostridiales bacterium]